MANYPNSQVLPDTQPSSDTFYCSQEMDTQHLRIPFARLHVRKTTNKTLGMGKITTLMTSDSGSIAYGNYLEILLN